MSIGRWIFLEMNEFFYVSNGFEQASLGLFFNVQIHCISELIQ